MQAGLLVGIARMAREAEPLEAKAKVRYGELDARSLLNRCSGGRVPFDWTLNPYRGCEFACKYCYARYTHEFMELREPEDFERLIFAKRLDLARLVRELRQVRPHDWIAIGTATDPYQPAERRYGRTRAVLGVFAGRAGFRLVLTTKSDLIARDSALLAAIAGRNRLRVSITVTTMDNELARAVEPLAPRPELRMRAVEALSRAGIDTGVFASPVMPGLNDSPESLERVARAAASAGARRFGASLLFLKPCAFRVFMPFIEQREPRLAAAYRRRYAGRAHLGDSFKARLESIVSGLVSKYGFRSRSDAEGPEWGQLALFDQAAWPDCDRIHSTQESSPSCVLHDSGKVTRPGFNASTPERK